MVNNNPKTVFRAHIAIPNDHGSWVFLLSPLLIGLFISEKWSEDSAILVISALAAFLLRQPFIIATKAYSGRHSRNDLPAARFWILAYGITALSSLTILVLRGFQFLLLLTIPGLLVFTWYLWLVRQRAERHKLGLDIVASGVLALAAPAALWVSAGEPLALGWWLWGLVWLQSAASIVYAFARLEQRSWSDVPEFPEWFSHAWRPLVYTGFNLISVAILSRIQILPTWLWLAYALQFAETVWGILNPAIGVKPTRIGMRQLMVSILFTILFIWTWGA